MTAVTPEVTWAQRSSASSPEKNLIYLTIVASDVQPKKAKIDLQPTHVEFTGTSDTKKATYHVKLDFFAEIDVKESITHHTPRDVSFVLRKKDHKDEYWPRLTKDKSKLHFLKTDFDKWVDEDEQDAVEDDNAMGGMGGMGGMGSDGGFGGIDFSKLGGAGMPGLGGDDGEDDDDDMPDLDDENDEAEEPAAGSSKAKIQEVS